MSARLAGLFLVAMTVVFSYVMLVVGDLVPRFFRLAYKLKPDEVSGFMPYPTRFAVGASWVFVVAVIMALSGAFLVLRLYPSKVVRVTVTTACVEALVVWTAFFCFCYDGFCGPINSHHGPEFDAMEFCRLGAGIFPIALALILIPLFGCFTRWSASPVRARPCTRPSAAPSASPEDKSGVTEGRPSEH